ncbi:MAG: hypothetical protein ACD_79C01467G0002 [uncultured bacterium]|nr:MAG: hypothetical protein ACD_79C01467G0002 [uncultured bacterium]
MRIPFKAWYYRSTIDENKVREKFSEFTIEFEDPLVIRISETLRVMVTSFGAVVFWPFDEGMARLVSSRVRETLIDTEVVEEVEDRLVVETETKNIQFLHNEVHIPGEASPPTMKIIAMLLAQSVALDHLENTADGVLMDFSPLLEDLSKKGRITISARKSLKLIGFAMQTRFSVLENLALFDKPAETWDSDEMEELYQGLIDFFDIGERQEVLNAKLEFINENTKMLFEVLSSRKSHYLDWIIIVLIAIEIFGFALYELLR